MSDWQTIHDFFQPKKSKYWVEQPSMKQKLFLRSMDKEVLFGGAAGGGKEIDLNQSIATPLGFVPLKNISVGDKVFGRDGKLYTVLAESEVHVHTGYRFTFDDGATVVTNNEHLWLTYNARELEALTKRSDEFRKQRRKSRPSRATNSQGAYKSSAIAKRNTKESFKNCKPAPTGTIRSTQEIVNTLTARGGRANHAIPVADPIQLPEQHLPIDPYTLGAWLGDGSSSAGEICGEDPQIWDECAYPIKSVRRPKSHSDNPKFGIATFEGLRKLLRTHDLLGNKHVPNNYLWASEDQRLALLQGLMDTDGGVEKSSVAFTNTNRNLTEGVAHLARSLGMKVTVRERRTTLYGKDCGPAWVVKFAANRIVFRLQRKANAQNIATRRTTKFRYIKSVEPIDAIPMKCLKVSAPDELFLVTEHFIPTHNSSALLMSALQFVNVPDYSAILFRKTFADLNLPGALMDRFRDWMADFDDVKWNSNTYTATFPSGARVTFGYLNNVNDFLRYKGPMVPWTEVLTTSGWKRIDEIEVGDLVASMDPSTRKWDYEPVTKLWEYDHDGPLYSPRAGSNVSFEVTGNHTWWVSTPRRPDLRKYRTDELPKVAKFPQAATFTGGVKPGVTIFPSGHTGPKANDLVFSASQWADFLGWYIAEGSGSSGTINITLYDSHSAAYKDALEAELIAVGARVNRSDKSLRFTNSKLLRWLKDNTGQNSHTKRIPDEVFGWDTDTAKVLLQSLVEGDGTWRTPKNAHYVTVSEELADGVMRLAQHCGYRATLDRREDHTTTPDGKEHDVVAFHVHLLYKVNADTGISLANDNQPIISRPYRGKVHCITVPPHHTFLTRHNGRVVWTGNSEFQFCVRGDTNILMADGSVKPIQTIIPGKDQVQTLEGQCNVTRKWHVGMKESVKVTTPLGSLITSTSHRMLTASHMWEDPISLAANQLQPTLSIFVAPNSTHPTYCASPHTHRELISHPYANRMLNQTLSVSDEVVEISPVGEQDLWDIRVEGASHYISADTGIISSNCGMDEVTEIRQNDYTYLFSRLRRPPTGPLSQVPLRMRATTNPAPNWVRQRFIVEGKSHGRIFIPSTLMDNPGIDHVSYRETLAELSPVERQRLEFGDWWATSLGTMFRREDFVTLGHNELPEFGETTQWVRFWDLAGTKPGPGNPDPDWTVGVLAAFHEGRYYIMDVQRIRDDGAAIEQLIRRTAILDGREIPIRMEQEPGSAGKNLIDQYARYVLASFNFEGIRATGDKVTRAKPMESAVANGNVVMVRADWNTDFVDELSAFPEGKVHDDQVDSAVHGFNYAAGLSGGLRGRVTIVV